MGSYIFLIVFSLLFVAFDCCIFRLVYNLSGWRMELFLSEWDEWKQQQEEKLHPKVELPEAKKSKEAIIKRLVTPNELAKLKALQHINPAWWCGDSRFIEQFADATDETQITERQAWYIKVLWYKYRRQLGHDGPKPEGYNNR